MKMMIIMTAFTVSCVAVSGTESLLPGAVNSPIASPILPHKIDLHFHFNLTLKITISLAAAAASFGLGLRLYYKYRNRRPGGEGQGEIGMEVVSEANP
ncbi:hypothetical protein QL285_029341 [Trifolium repens]|jgi:hypothetical protein|nr:hypothetical protein QL285_029341 [Trifolium repens]